MLCLANWIFYSYQFYTIFFAFTYIFIDIEKRIVKCYSCIKIYVYFINLLYAILLLYYFQLQLTNRIQYITWNAIMDYVNMILYIFRLIILGGLICQRLQLENLLNKWQISYMDQLIHLTTDKFMRMMLILNILIVYLQTFDVLQRVFVILKYKLWELLREFSLLEIFIAMENYILLQHLFSLNYIKCYFSSLNNQLKNQQILGNLANIYSDLTLLLTKVNGISSPIIFCVFICQLLHISLNARHLFEVLRHIILWDIKEFYRICLFSSNILLYFLICNRIYKTLRATGEILKEYDDKQQNQEVSFIVLF